jgi:hypothetical protein
MIGGEAIQLNEHLIWSNYFSKQSLLDMSLQHEKNQNIETDQTEFKSKSILNKIAKL